MGHRPSCLPIRHWLRDYPRVQLVWYSRFSCRQLQRTGGHVHAPESRLMSSVFSLIRVLSKLGRRRIPIYCSHHVDMEYYVEQYAKSIAWLGNFFYWLFAKLPARYANANAAPTLCFLDSHIPHKAKGCMRVRIPSGVADERFKVDSDAQLAAERRDLERICGGSPDDCICIMVQRLAPEKDTMHALEALLQLRDGSETLAAAKAGKGKAIASASDRPFCTIDGKRKLRFVIAGDGPARKSLVNFTEKYKLPVTFTGNVKNDRLPPLYRAADVFVTCSTSET